MSKERPSEKGQQILIYFDYYNYKYIKGMGYYKIIISLNSANNQSEQKWIELNDGSIEKFNTGDKIKFKTAVAHTCLWMEL